MTRPFSKYDDEHILRRRAEGAELHLIARELRRCKKRVSSRFHQLSGKTQRRQWTLEEDDLLTRGLAEGLTYAAIARRIEGRNAASCGYRAQSMGWARGTSRIVKTNDETPLHGKHEEKAFNDMQVKGSKALLDAILRYARNNRTYPHARYILAHAVQS